MQYSDVSISFNCLSGIQDFSEDTYRTLAAADNAVMLVDAAKGLEPQTRKLFEVIFFDCIRCSAPRDMLSIAVRTTWKVNEAGHGKFLFSQHRRLLLLFISRFLR